MVKLPHQKTVYKGRGERVRDPNLSILHNCFRYCINMHRHTHTHVFINPWVCFNLKGCLLCKKEVNTSYLAPVSPFKKECIEREWNWHSNRHAVERTLQRHLRSKIRWFTESCNSHYVSQFAAFFIDARAKRSTVKSCHVHFLLEKKYKTSTFSTR